MRKAFKPGLSPKQLQFVAMCHRQSGAARYNLIAGPRQSIKTTAALHAIAENLWNVNHSFFSVISPTVTAGDDQGCWSQLTQQVIPEWIAGDFGMKWVTEPRQKGTTKKLYCEVTNRHGGISRVQLDSLQYEDEAEDRFKNKAYSGVYVSELSYYLRRETFTNWQEVLRGQQYEDHEFIFIGDTNPSPDGQDSWIWKIWYEERIRESEDEGFKLMQKQYALMEFSVADNIFKDRSWHENQKAKYAHSEDLLARYYHGKWVKAAGNSVFHEVFRPNIHIAGEYETPTNPDPEILMPEPNCMELITGWDIGERNSAFVLIEKYYQTFDKGREWSLFKILDEVVYIGSTSSMYDFVAECYEKIKWWEEVAIGHPVLLRNWSDRSAFDRQGPTFNTMQHQLVYNETDGKIILTSVDRRPGSVQQRLDFTKRLMFENRLLISRSRCPHLIDSFQSLRPGPGTQVVHKTSPYKHAWDAFSYAIISECLQEVMFATSREPATGRAGLLTVPL